MKKFKLMIVVFMMMLVSGCSAEVDILIDTNKKVIETTEVTVLKSFLDPYYSSENEIKSYYKTVLNEYDNDDSDYSLNVKYKDQSVVGTIKNTNKNILDVSGIESLLFKEVHQEENTYTFILNPDISSYFIQETEMDLDPEGLVDEFVINIQSFYDIESSNSLYQNTSTNTYTWVIDKSNLEQNIEFTLSNKKRYDIIIPYVVKKYIGYVILGLLGLCIGIFILFIVHKSRVENEI